MWGIAFVFQHKIPGVCLILLLTWRLVPWANIMFSMNDGNDVWCRVAFFWEKFWTNTLFALKLSAHISSFLFVCFKIILPLFVFSIILPLLVIFFSFFFFKYYLCLLRLSIFNCFSSYTCFPQYCKLTCGKVVYWIVVKDELSQYLVYLKN